MALTFVSPLSGKELTSAGLQQTLEHKRHFSGEPEEKKCYVTMSTEMMKICPCFFSYKQQNKVEQLSNTTDINPSFKKLYIFMTSRKLN